MYVILDGDNLLYVGMDGRKGQPATTPAEPLSIVDRFTGALLQPFAQSSVHRGADDAPIARLLWPRGDVRT